MERIPRRTAIIGAAVGFAGIAASARTASPAQPSGHFVLVVLAVVFWGAGNVLAKTVGKVDMLAFTVWSSLAPPLPLLLLSLAVDGPAPLIGLQHPR